MAERNRIHDAVVLRSRESPSGDRILTLLTADSGLVDAFVFGGGRSKLRSLASPYVHGRAFIYADPVKDYRKLSDFEVIESFTGIRESLQRLWGASVAAEMLIRSSGGGGDFDEVTALTLDTLRALDKADDDQTVYPTILFLWRLLVIIGLGPDIHACVACGRPLSAFPSGEDSGGHSAGRNARPSAVFLDPLQEGLLCLVCASRTGTYGMEPRGSDPRDAANGQTEVSPGALRWLMRAEGLPFAAALRAGLDKLSLDSLESLVFSLARRAAETPLYTLAGY